MLNSIKSAVKDSTTVPATPQLHSPLNQAQGVIDSVTLSWFPIENAESYRIQLSGDSIFTSIFLDSTVSTATSVFIEDIPSSQKYFWRVSAINDSGGSNFTSARMFTTAEALLNHPDLISPKDSALKIPVEITFTWSNIPTAGSYNLQMANSPDICDVFLDTVIVNDTSCVIGGLENSKVYYWHVRSLPDDGSTFAAGTFSEWYSFTTIASPPSIPVLSSPSDDAKKISTNPILRWETSAYTEYYEVRISMDYDFIQIITDTLGLSVTNLKIKNLLPNTTYYWSVKAYNEVGESGWSEIRKFTTGSPNDDLTQLDGETREFELFQNYPNPFNAETVLRFGLPVESNVQIFISDIQGQYKKIITNLRLNTGIYEIQFDGLNLASGVYFYTIVANAIDKRVKQKNFIQTKKMLMIK